MTEKEKDRLEFAKNSVQKRPEVIIGKNCDIDDAYGTYIGLRGFGWARDTDDSLVKVNHSGGVKIGDNVEIRAFVTIDQATLEGNYTEIGEGTKLDHHVHIAHNSKIGKHNTIANGCSIEGSCEIGDFNSIGSMVVMQRKTKLGSNNIVGSGSVITKDFGDNLVIVGNPAKILKENKPQ